MTEALLGCVHFVTVCRDSLEMLHRHFEIYNNDFLRRVTFITYIPVAKEYVFLASILTKHSLHNNVSVPRVMVRQ